MARGLKTRGLEELDLLRRRVKRQHLLKRIGKEDCDWLVEQLDKIEARIITMSERGEDL